MSLSDSNYYNDHRVRAREESEDSLGFDETRMTLTLEVEVEDEETGEYEEKRFTFPATFEVCPTCHGKGSHVNPSIDCDGITQSEWAEWDHEERQYYMNGAYDVTCYGCDGKRVVPTIAENRLTEEQQEAMKLVEKKQQDDADFRALQRAERAMGA